MDVVAEETSSAIEVLAPVGNGKSATAVLPC